MLFILTDGICPNFMIGEGMGDEHNIGLPNNRSECIRKVLEDFPNAEGASINPNTDDCWADKTWIKSSYSNFYPGTTTAPHRTCRLGRKGKYQS